MFLMDVLTKPARAALSERAMRVDFALFALLVASLCLYQLQFVLPAIETLHFREALYAYLYLRVLLYYRLPDNRVSQGTLIYLFLAALVGVHTWLAYTGGLAGHALLRFLYAAPLAPLAFALVRTRAQVWQLLALWTAVAMLGVLSVAAQTAGAPMEWMVRGYIAIRADLVRYKSLLGEPNVNGMVGAIVYVGALLAVRPWLLRTLLLAAALFLLIMSLSKAALMVAALATLVVALSGWKWTDRQAYMARAHRLAGDLLAVCVIIGLAFSISATSPYAKISYKLLAGQYTVETSAVQDLSDRTFAWRYVGDPCPGLANLSGNRAWELTRCFGIGQSFGRAGSSAVELKVPQAVGPHNSYIEIFLVGGSLLLGAFLYLLWQTGKSLARSRAEDLVLFRFCLFSFLLIVLFMVGYPNIYEPVTGCLLWLLVGVAGSAAACPQSSRQ
jgi:hypothetical protein